MAPKPIPIGEFATLLGEIRDGAAETIGHRPLTETASEVQQDVVVEHAKRIWNIAEFALAMLDPAYIPQRDALIEARNAVARHGTVVDHRGEDDQP